MGSSREGKICIPSARDSIGARLMLGGNAVEADRTSLQGIYYYSRTVY